MILSMRYDSLEINISKSVKSEDPELLGPVKPTGIQFQIVEEDNIQGSITARAFITTKEVQKMAEKLGLINAANRPNYSMYDDTEAKRKALNVDAIFAAAEQFKRTVEQFGFRSHEDKSEIKNERGHAQYIYDIIEQLNAAIEEAKGVGINVKVRLGRGALAEDGKHLWADISRPIEPLHKPHF